MARLLFLFSLLLAAMGALAQEPAFLIERIEVRGTRFTSAAVIKKQTLLREGETYSEAQIKAAVDRVNRLPFVVDAEPALEKGSEREHYVLAIRITETKPLFVDARSSYSRVDGASRWNDDDQFESGVRGFVGSTLIHASTDFRGAYNLGVTQYDLFGTSAYAALNVTVSDRRNFSSFTNPETGEHTETVFERDPSIGVLVGIPVNNNNSVQVVWGRGSATATTVTGTNEPLQMRTTGQSGSAAWIYDSTDDALFPTRGNFARGGVFLATSNAGAGVKFRQETAFADLRHYWNFAGQQSVSIGASAAYLHTPPRAYVFNNENDTSYGVVAGYSTSLWPRAQTIRYGDLRFETEARYSATTQQRGFHSTGLAAGLAFRNPWGLLRFNVNYEFIGDRIVETP